MGAVATISQVETEMLVLRFENDILYIYVKPVKPTISMIDDSMKAIKGLIKDVKVCALVDPTEAKDLTRELRKHLVQSFSKLLKAMGVINLNTWLSIFFNFMVKLDKPKFPMRAFQSEEEALLWLKEF